MTVEILIVDDEPDILNMLKILLETEGYAIRTSSNGPEAIEAFTSRPCDVVLTDIKMPGMTGIELLRRIKAIDKNVEVIILTGHGTIENAVEALKGGEAFDFIQKPLADVDLLVASVQRAGERRSLQLKNEAIIQELRKLSRAVEHSPSMLAITDRSGRLEYVNPKFTDLTGYAPSECLGQSLSLLKSGLHDRGFYRHLWKTIQSGEEWRGEFKNRKKNGDIYWESASISPIRKESGEITHFVKVSGDITQSKLAEEALRKSEQLNTAILNAIAYPILVLDKNGDIVKSNTAWQDFIKGKRQMEPADSVIINYLECCMISMKSVKDQDERFSEEVIADIQRVIEGRQDRYETQVRCGGSSDIRWYMLQVCRLDVETSLTLVCQIDITLLKRMEGRMIHHRKMEAVATLAAGIAHEFNNALAGVTGNVDLLELKTGGRDSIEKYLHGIRLSCQRMHDLSQRLLAYAKGAPQQVAPLHVSTAIQRVITPLRREMPKEIALDIRVHPPDLTVRIDFLQLQIVLSELVKNATESIHGSGTVRVDVGQERVDPIRGTPVECARSRDCLRIIVQDTGEGMDEETRERIFEPFFTSKFIGRGVGMSVVYGIVKGYAGNIKVSSTPGKGTSVSVYFPFARKRAVEPLEAWWN